jgi:hypothetical protein
MRESHWKSLEHGSSIPAGKFSDFFWSIPTNFKNHRNSPEPAVSGPSCSTWVKAKIQQAGGSACIFIKIKVFFVQHSL